jgi:hypothetical protein
MADTKISALTGVSAVAGTNEVAVNESGASKKASFAQIATYLKTLGVPRVAALASAHTISATTATEVTGLGPMTLEAGTYQFTFMLICSQAATGTGIRLGLNFTGTAAQRAFVGRFPSTGTTAISGVADDVGATSGQIVEHSVVTAYSTTAPNMGNAGTATANGKYLFIIEGTIVVTASGDLELWHGSSAAAASTVDAGSTLSVIRCA